MRLNKKELITSITHELQGQLDWINSEITPLPDESLNWKAGPNSWSILECLEHLNRYGEVYLPQFEKSLINGSITESESYKTGWLGSYFAKSMLTKNGMVKNKMKTQKDKNPSGSELDRTVIDKHLDQQNRLLKTLEESKNLDFNSVKIATSLGKWLRLNYGDALRFFFNHISRHYVQLKRINLERLAELQSKG